ncbi:MAG: AraC family transcriptional regulator [Eubacteriales bacterium]|nr:AraC family transcriptional regulator [Eubacteriales bacterium]
MNPFYEKQEGKLRISINEQLSFPEHLHSHTEFLYIIEGETQISIEGTVYNMKQGDCAIIFPEQIHSYHATGHNRLWLLIFDPNLAGSLQYTLQKFRPGRPWLPKASVPDDVRLAIERIYTLDMQKNPGLGSAWIQVILTLILPMLELTEENQPKSEGLTYQLVHYMTEHFREPLSLDTLAKALHVNKYYLSHTFSEKLHISFPQYLNYLRVEYAAEAMHMSQKPLAHIWEEAGFSSQRSFNRAFHAAMGMSPLAYRKSIP